MERLLRLAALPLALALPLAGQAQNAFVIADTTLRAGPAPEYPDITLLPYGTWVDVQGCTGGWEWCDVVADDPYNDRGWVPGDYVQYEYQDQPVSVVEYGPRIGIPIISFSIAAYWDNHYRSRPFYNERDQWYHRRIARISPPPPPPRPPGGWHVPPPPQPGGGHHENPPNPPHVPVNPPHSSGGHVHPPSPPHVPVNPPHSGGPGHVKSPNPPHVPVYAPQPAAEPTHAPQPQHGPPVKTPHPVAAPHPSHPASSEGHSRKPPEQNPKKKKDNNGNNDNGGENGH